MTKWIKCSELLPKEGQHVIGYALSANSNHWYVGMIRYSQHTIKCPFWDDSTNSHPRKVTHWMPLPDAPKDE